MRNLFGILSLMLLFGFSACKGSGEKTAKATTAETVSQKTMGDSYAVSPTASSITWIGSKKIGGGKHRGTLSLSSGNLMVEKGAVSGGTFSINMNSLTDVDMIGKEGAGKLEGHLKSPDFFDIAKFPVATFEITKVTKVMNNPAMTHTVSGNLEMMGISKNISMPATISMDGGKVTASVSDFAINRTDWGVKYGSGLLGLAQDKIINDDVVIGLTLEASK